ncbi:small multi-drug export protein [Patescibacteria group bacterium]|nr:small multi-drug export protein [Patescibacteria group bacterium]MBU1029462.1 small multi-drug export protein [Patescibacteria group bacterium]MBU1916191.1 small multi-drug export protein [Patescibacteria group bacterium]
MLNIPPEILILTVAAAPIVELRGSIPLAVGVFNMTICWAAILSVIGNLIPAFLIYWLGQLWIDWNERHQGVLHRLTQGVIRRSRKVFNDGKYEKYGLLALSLFVAIPLPMTGVWTGTVAAFLFGVSLKRALPFIALGAIIAAVIVSLVTTGALSFLDFLFISPLS